MWIPQLLASLRRHEFQGIAINILQKIASTFPQALHYSLRAFIAEIDLLLQYQTHKNRGGANTAEAPNGLGSSANILFKNLASFFYLFSLLPGNLVSDFGEMI
jgi:hypothetical protein